MSAIGRLWFKWVSDDTKPYSIDDVPNYWREEVEQLLAEEKKEREVIDENAGGIVGDNRESEPTN